MLDRNMLFVLVALISFGAGLFLQRKGGKVSMQFAAISYFVAVVAILLALISR
ncbi:MAG: hypothetical protein IPM23_20715 [Candidatus Melainabacteria bacterium]|nr:hypothetical protein [Candidatus Melainabacteria bacterium]